MSAVMLRRIIATSIAIVGICLLAPVSALAAFPAPAPVGGSARVLGISVTRRSVVPPWDESGGNSFVAELSPPFDPDISESTKMVSALNNFIRASGKASIWVTLEDSKSTLKVTGNIKDKYGKTKQLKSTVYDVSGDGEWNKKSRRIDVEGAPMAIPQSDMELKITVTSEDGLNKRDYLLIVAGQRHVTGITFKRHEISMQKNSEETLSYIVTPEDADQKRVKFTSDNTSVARVNYGGIVKSSNKFGIANIKAVTEDGGFEDVCKITVEKSSKPVTVNITGSSDTKEYTGEEQSFKSVFDYECVGCEKKKISVKLKSSSNDKALIKGTEPDIYETELTEEDFDVKSEYYSNITVNITNGSLIIKPKTPEYIYVHHTPGMIKDVTGDTEVNNAGTGSILNPSILNTQEELQSALNISDEDKAKGVNVWLKVTDDSVSFNDKSIIESGLVGCDCDIKQFVDIRLFKRVKRTDSEEISNPGGKIKFKIDIPPQAQNQGDLRIIMAYNGKFSDLDFKLSPDRKSATVLSDRFSTLAFVIQRANKTGLKETIAAAGKALEGVSLSSNGRDVPTNMRWIRPEEYAVLVLALDTAKGVYNDNIAEQARVDSAKTNLENALNTFNAGVKFGKVKPAANESARIGNVEYAAVYNYSYYINNNPDIKAAFNGDKRAVLNHFVNYGMSEGRRGCEWFDVGFYKNNYADLRAAFKDDLKAYYMHYIDYGRNEGRQGNGSNLSSPYMPVVENDMDYSSVYDYDYYINNNPDIKAAFNGDKRAALNHFVNYGMNEGRRGCAWFDVRSYRNAYGDLRVAFKNDLKAYYMHYINYGANEGRIAVDVVYMTNPVTGLNGVDFSPVYDYFTYLENNPDVDASFDGDEEATLNHFISYGMAEGRAASTEFNVWIYRSNYSDLQAAFGNDLKSYYMHYLNYGMKEGRTAK